MNGQITPKVAYILLGSNIEPRRNIQTAIQHLCSHFGSIELSKIYETQPVLRKNSSNYLNAVARVRTSLDPMEIKYSHLRAIEDEMGRERTQDKYSPRVIDLDLIIWGEGTYRHDVDGLILPDPEILEYPHVALPLSDIAPTWIHPINGLTSVEIASRLVQQTSNTTIQEVQI